MARHNDGRDIEGDILCVLAEHGPLTIREMQEHLAGHHPTGGPPSRSTVSRHVDALFWNLPRLVATDDAPRGAIVYRLTDQGHRAADARGLNGRTEA